MFCAIIPLATLTDRIVARVRPVEFPSQLNQIA